MRIKTLTLKPFAGISDRTLQFSPGLNIITGPNEAGKSTLLQALEAVLFTPVELSKAKYEKLIKNYLPASGGNIIRVYLTFQSADKEFHLKKEWKAGGKDGVCIIRSEVDGEYTGDKEVSEYFSQYLPAKEGTIKNILLTWQSALDRTKDVFNGNGQDVRSDLGNILRSSIMETDGVSVDKLKEKITQEYKDYFDHWDITKNEPENRRGINNPYTREVGKILKAYYEKENITRDYTLAVQIEEEIDSINDEIKIKEEKQAGIKDKLTKYESLKSPFIERQQIESEIKIISNQMENIIENSESWTIQENWLSNNAEIEIQKIEERISRLEKEKADIQTFLEHKGFRERFKKLKELFNNIRKADNQLSQVFPITREEIDILQEKKQQIEEIKKIITASKLRLLFKAKNLQKITTKDTTGLKEEHVVNKDQTFEKVFQGKLSIDQQDWSLEVQAGEGEIDVLLARQEKTEKEYLEKLAKTGVNSLEEAQSENRKYEQYKNEMYFARQSFQQELGNDSYENLQKKYEELAKENQPSSLDADKKTINITNSIRDLKEIEKKKDKFANNIKRWQEEYGTKRDLLLKIGENQYKLEKAREKLKNLPELPAEFSDYKNFFDYLDLLNREKEQYREDIYNLREQKNKKELEKPEFSSEELLVMLNEVKQKYQRIYLEGEAIALINSKTTELLSSTFQNPYKEFQLLFKDYFMKMCADSFTSVKMEGDYPSRLIKPDGSELSYDLLSFGTKDVFSLALRLTMANYFLADKEGFLVLDDPLVDMDFNRQSLAAQQINEFAKTKQVIFLTCHNHTADLLVGERIML